MLVSAFYLAARTLPERYFALLAGFTETMALLGGVAGEALLARSVIAFGWRYTMCILASIALIISILSYVTIKDNNLIEAKEPLTPQPNLKGLTSILFMPQAIINGLFCGLMFGVVAAFGAFWCIPFLMNVYMLSLHDAADIASLFFVGGALGTPMVGFLSDRLGSRKSLMLIGAASALIIFSIILYVSPRPLWYLCLLIFLLGFFAAVYLLPFAVIRDITSSHIRGTAMGYINMMCILIGSPVIQPLIGWLLHLYSYKIALSIIPVSLLLAFTLACFVKETV